MDKLTASLDFFIANRKNKNGANMLENVQQKELVNSKVYSFHEALVGIPL